MVSGEAEGVGGGEAAASSEASAWLGRREAYMPPSQTSAPG